MIQLLSIIIPTFNEEKYLPNLLSDIKHQTYSDYEVIVADAHSKDKTRKIADEWGAKVVDGGKPAVGRNAGAKAANGEYFLFFDADVSIKPNFLENMFDEFQKKYLDVATCDYVADSDKTTISLLLDMYNSYARTAQFVRPSCGGACIITTRRLFERLGGFDETLHLAEDHDFARRAKKIAQFRILDSVSIIFSTRRINKEGLWQFLSKNIKSEFLQIINGKVESDQITYEFGNYDADLQKHDQSEFKENLLQLKKRFRKWRKKII